MAFVPPSPTAFPSTPSRPQSTRSIKRKPPPSLHELRYPQPDPDDPFAPLTTLRLKAATRTCEDDDVSSMLDDGVLSMRSGRSHVIYPAPPLPESGCLASHPYRAGDDNMAQKQNKRQSLPHYRRRAHAATTTDAFHATDGPAYLESVPSLIADDGSRSSSDNSVAGDESDSSVSPRRPRSRISRLLGRGKKASDTHSIRSGASEPSRSPKASSEFDSPLIRHSSLTPPSHASPRTPSSASLSVSNLLNRDVSSPFPSSYTPDQDFPRVEYLSDPETPSRRSKNHTTVPLMLTSDHFHLPRPRLTSTSNLSISTLPLSQPTRNATKTTSSASSYVEIIPSDYNLQKFETETLDHSHSPFLSSALLNYASSLEVVSENGLHISFSRLCSAKHTIVIFLRHFWCAACHVYLASLSQELDRITLGLQGINVVLIGNGSPSIIKSFRNLFHLPFEMYTDPTLQLYSAFDLGSLPRQDRPQRSSRQGSMRFVMNAVRVGMPIWERGGDFSQLGGAFVLERGNNCVWAHRMSTIDDYAPIGEVLRHCKTTLQGDGEDAAIGSREDDMVLSLKEMLMGGPSEPKTPPRGTVASSPSSPVQEKFPRQIERSRHRRHTIDPGARDSFLALTTEESEEVFMEKRRKSLQRIQERRRIRRGYYLVDNKAEESQVNTLTVGSVLGQRTSMIEEEREEEAGLSHGDSLE